MPNNFLTIGLCARSSDDNCEMHDVDFAPLKDVNLCELACPRPDAFDRTTLSWQLEHWGTKWGTYNTKVIHMVGDGAPMLIEFESAWGPPSPEIMRKIDRYLNDTYHLCNIRWIGHDPSCGKTRDVEVEE